MFCGKGKNYNIIASMLVRYGICTFWLHTRKWKWWKFITVRWAFRKVNRIHIFLYMNWNFRVAKIAGGLLDDVESFSFLTYSLNALFWWVDGWLSGTGLWDRVENSKEQKRFDEMYIFSGIWWGVWRRSTREWHQNDPEEIMK